MQKPELTTCMSVLCCDTVHRSVEEDVNKLSKSCLIPDTVGIYGFAFSTDDGSLREITRREPKDRPAMAHMN
jgi:carbonic anhydrase